MVKVPCESTVSAMAALILLRMVTVVWPLQTRVAAAADYCKLPGLNLNPHIRVKNITVFYFRRYNLPNNTLVLVAPASSRPVNTLDEAFGDVRVFDDPISESLVPARVPVGRHRGSRVTMVDTSEAVLTGSLEFTNSSWIPSGTIEFVGVPATGGYSPGTLSISGGTGNFSFASGLVTRSAISFDGSTLLGRVQVCYTRFPFVMDHDS